MPPAMSSTWVEADAELGEGQQRQLAGEELLQQVGDLRGVAGAVDAAGLDDHAGQAVLGDHPLGDLVRLAAWSPRSRR